LEPEAELRTAYEPAGASTRIVFIQVSGRPSGHRELGRPQSIAMAALRINVHLRRNLGILEREKICRRILHVHGIVFGLHDERRRSFLAHMDLRIGSEVLL